MAAPDATHSARIQHQGQPTETWAEQLQVEERILLIRQTTVSVPTLLRDSHISWLRRSLHVLPRGYDAFDALQGWAAFWIVHSHNLLSTPLSDDDADTLVHYLSTFVDTRRGAYGGGPRQAAHLASTFAAVMALVSIGTPRALSSIDVKSISRFLRHMKRTDGSFQVSEGGEIDVRAAYCALAVGTLLNVDPNDEWLRQGVAGYIARLQAFDGGLGGEPGAEAHGGNTYCGLAALILARAPGAIDREQLLDWAVMRQMGFEGGFQGRANKLVDSCYSFWVGALFPLLGLTDGVDGIESSRMTGMFEAERLQRYVLECCQVGIGGLRDKPGTPRDFMHTCYALSGLSVAQHFGDASDNDGANAVERINVVYNLQEDRFKEAWRFFHGEQ